MSCRREAPTNDFSVALSPATKREFFHASKYSDIVGVITTSAVSASCSFGRPLLGGGVELVRLALELLDRGEVEARVGQRLAEGDLAVAVEVGLGRELRLGAVERALDQEEEVARLLERAPVLGLDRERDGGLGIRGVAAGVDDHVVVGELGHPGDDALHLLVGGVGALTKVALASFISFATSSRCSASSVLLSKSVDGGELVVRLGVLAQLAHVGLQPLGVVEQVGLDRAEILRRRAWTRRASCVGVGVGVPAGGERTARRT